jgi:hypothetical protein
VRSVFLVALIPCFFNHALCSACALVSAAVLGRLACLPFGVDILITRDIRLALAGCAGELYQIPQRMSCSTVATHGGINSSHAAASRIIRGGDPDVAISGALDDAGAAGGVVKFLAYNGRRSTSTGELLD